MFVPFSSRSPYARLSSPETDDRRPSDPLPIVCFDGTEFPDRSDGQACNQVSGRPSRRPKQSHAGGRDYPDRFVTAPFYYG